MSKLPESILVEDEDGKLYTIPADTPEEALRARGWEPVEDKLAVSRPRKTRTKSQMQKLIKNGVVREPGAPKPRRKKSDNEYVIHVPTATATGKVN
jgi:hypothetical protein